MAGVPDSGPGHPGRLPAPGSHRSGLARRGGIRLFISCRYQREPVSCVDMVEVSMYLPCFPTTVHETASPSLAGVPQVGSPGSSVL